MVSGSDLAGAEAQAGIAAVTDAHVHAVSGDIYRYPRRSEGPGRDWWSGRAVDGDTVLGDLAEAGIVRAVLVQAVGAYGNDNRYARSVVDSHLDRLAFVPAIDAESDDPVGEISQLMAHCLVAGIRLFGVDAEPRWLTDGRGRAIWEVARECDITLVPTLFPRHLTMLGTLVAETPEARVALDHCAFPNLRSGPPYPAASALFALAEYPSVHLKITSLVLRDAAAHGGMMALIEQLVGCFGPDRLCWGSDYPQTTELLYPAMVGLAKHAVSGVDFTAQRSILDLTARQLFWRDA